MIIEIFVFEYTLTYKDELNDYVLINFNKTIKKAYGHVNSIHLNNALDNVQNQLECCGTSNYTDWIDTYWYTHRSLNELENDTQVPQSCCFNYEQDDNYNKIYCMAKSNLPTPTDKYFTEGCYTKLKKLISIYYAFIEFLLILLPATQFLVAAAGTVVLDYKTKLIRRSSHQPYVNIEAEYSGDTKKSNGNPT